MILQVLNAERSYLNKAYGVKNICLFGSYSRGEEGSNSDLDFLIEFDRPIGFFKFIEFWETIKNNLPSFKQKIKKISADLRRKRLNDGEHYKI